MTRHYAKAHPLTYRAETSSTAEPVAENPLSVLAKVAASIVRYAGRLPKAHSVEVDDLAQVGFEAVLRSISRWKPDGGASITTYVTRAAFRDMADFANEFRGPCRVPISSIRERLAEGNPVDQTWVSLDAPANVGATESSKDRLEAYSPPPDFGAQILELKRKLSPHAYQLFCDQAEGLSEEEQTTAHGVSRERLRQRRVEARAGLFVATEEQGHV